MLEGESSKCMLEGESRKGVFGGGRDKVCLTAMAMGCAGRRGPNRACSGTRSWKVGGEVNGKCV